LFSVLNLGGNEVYVHKFLGSLPAFWRGLKKLNQILGLAFGLKYENAVFFDFPPRA
jgi:hypothetical protein